MSPTPLELGVIAGNCVRLERALPSGAKSAREQFFVREAPAPGEDGVLSLIGKLSNEVLQIHTFILATM